MVVGMKNSVTASCDPLLNIPGRIIDQDFMWSAELLLEFLWHHVNDELGPEDSSHPLALLLLEYHGGRRARQENRFKVLCRFL